MMEIFEWQLAIRMAVAVARLLGTTRGSGGGVRHHRSALNVSNWMASDWVFKWPGWIFHISPELAAGMLRRSCKKTCYVVNIDNVAAIAKNVSYIHFANLRRQFLRDLCQSVVMTEEAAFHNDPSILECSYYWASLKFTCCRRQNLTNSEMS
jgi:hypothetical protein